MATGGQAVKGNMEEWRDAELRYFQKKNVGLCGTCIFLYNQQMAALTKPHAATSSSVLKVLEEVVLGNKKKQHIGFHIID